MKDELFEHATPLRPVNWRLCEKCAQAGYRKRHIMATPTRRVAISWVRNDGLDERYDVFLRKEAWHRKVNAGMFQDWLDWCNNRSKQHDTTRHAHD